MAVLWALESITARGSLNEVTLRPTPANVVAPFPEQVLMSSPDRGAPLARLCTSLTLPCDPFLMIGSDIQEQTPGPIQKGTLQMATFVGMSGDVRSFRGPPSSNVELPLSYGEAG